MSTIVRRQNPGNNAALPSVFSEWDPFRLMDSLLRWEPYQEVAAARRGDQVAFVPHFDVKETKDAFHFKADLPGVSENDIDISLSGNQLMITGKREAEQQQTGENFFMMERSYGSFTRSFALPTTADVDKIKADLRNGVLTIELPKRAESQPRKIAVKSATNQPSQN
jgi:HSP20 family protein